MHWPLRWGLVLLLKLWSEVLKLLLLLLLHGTRVLLVVSLLRLVPSLPLLVRLLLHLRVGRRSSCCHGHDHAKLRCAIAGWHLNQLERLAGWHARRYALHHVLHGTML